MNEVCVVTFQCSTFTAIAKISDTFSTIYENATINDIVCQDNMVSIFRHKFNLLNTPLKEFFSFLSGERWQPYPNESFHRVKEKASGVDVNRTAPSTHAH